MSAARDPVRAQSAVRRAFQAARAREQTPDLCAVADEPIAVIGMACRFAGGADDPEAFWEMLCSGTDGIREWPEARRRSQKEDALWNDATASAGGYLDAVDGFDAAFFGITPREAERLDPQQRLLLEVAWEGLEDAGLSHAVLDGQRCGVFVGVSLNDYCRMQLEDVAGADAYSLSGSTTSMVAGRVAYLLNLKGECAAVDTACSSSLSAVHLACRSLVLGESDVALAGGVHLLLGPHSTVLLSKWGALAPDARCKAFDARADGFVRGEGSGIVVLKRLSEALAEGDRIHGVIRGSCMGQDGRSAGITAPNLRAQVAVLRGALERAGVEPRTVDFVETHGTGTELGDPIEVEAILAAYGTERSSGRALRLGAVKTNLGHAEAAAGVAGLIKALLCLRHRRIPANLHFESLNPKIEAPPGSLEVPTRLQDWPEGARPRRAGVSSFGISGTNVHVVLEQAPPEREAEPNDARACRLVPLSARSGAALQARAAELDAHLERRGAPALDDLVGTLARRRTHHPIRTAFVARDLQELRAGLGRVAAEPPPRSAGPNEPGVAFVFSGQGSQWCGMGEALRREAPTFAASIKRTAEVIADLAGWSLLAELSVDGGGLEHVERIQPAVFAQQVALAELLRGHGVEPLAVTGHSMGEVAAAHVSGALSLEAAVRVIVERSALVADRGRGGRMLAVELEPAAARAVASRYDGVTVAALNGPRNVLLAGAAGAIEALAADLARLDVFCRLVDVDYASHSPAMDPLLPELRARLASLQPGPTVVPFVSAVDAAEQPGPVLDGRYWARNLREPVNFAGALAAAGEAGCDVFVEVGPHPVLSHAIHEWTRAAEGRGRCTATLRRDQPEHACFLEALGTLYGWGVDLDWQILSPWPRRRAELPGYPWQRKSYWLARPGEGSARRRAGDPFAAAVESSIAPGAAFVELTLENRAGGLLSQHRVGERTLVPAAAFLDWGRRIAMQRLGTSRVRIASLRLERALELGEEEDRVLQCAIEPGSDECLNVTFCSRPGDRSAQAGDSWETHATAQVAALPEGPQPDSKSPLEPATAAARCPERRSVDAHYEALSAEGLHYGEAYRGWSEIRVGEAQAFGRLEAASGSADPLLGWAPRLDALLQLAVAACGETGGLLPVGVDRVEWLGAVEGPLAAHATVREETGASPERCADIDVWDDAGRRVASIEGLRARRVGAAANAAARLRHAVEWRPAAGPSDDEQRGSAPRRRLIVASASDPHAPALVEAMNADGQVCETREVASVGSTRCDSGPADEVVVVVGARDDDDAALGCAGLLAWVQALVQAGERDPARLSIVTFDAQPAASSDAATGFRQAAAWGLARAVAIEHPELRCRRIDASAADSLWPSAVAAELRRADREDEVALRSGARLVPRIVRCDAPPVTDTAPEPRRLASYRLGIDPPGVLDRLALVEEAVPVPGPREVVVEVRTAGLNFRDVLVAMGLVPDATGGPVRLGGECTGLVAAVGAEVTEWKVGDDVVAITLGAFARFAVAPAEWVVPRPPQLAPELAGSLAQVFMTAEYALRHVARMEAGQRLLVHSAAGGVGHAALEVARALGVEVLATAGSEPKRAYLRSKGIRHVFDSRTLEFADRVLACTDGRGVDVVLNSVSGAAVERGIACLAPHGWFLELGKRDLLEDAHLHLRPFLANLTYRAIDLASLADERPQLFAALLRDAVEGVAAGRYRPPPVTTFRIEDAAEAFRWMAQAGHVGRISLDLTEPPPAPAIERSRGLRVVPDGSYLIAGGLSGLGLETAEWLARRSARWLVLCGRHDPSPEALERVRRLEAAGVRVRVSRTDVTDAPAVRRLVEEIDRTSPPLRGVVHSAVVLDDGLVVQLDRERLARVCAPKVQGAVHLDRATRDHELDFFLVYSSAASMLGSPGQASYCAANAALDAFVRWRRAQGRVTAAVSWGALETGQVTAERKHRLARRGLRAIPPGRALDEMAEALAGGAAQVGIFDLDLRQWLQFFPAASGRSLFADLVTEPAAGARSSEVLSALRALQDPRARRELLEQHVRTEIAAVMRMEPGELDAALAFDRMGVDSLMAVELRNRLEGSLGVALSTTLVWAHPTIDGLCGQLARRLAIEDATSDEEGAPKLDAGDEEAIGELLAAAEALSVDELTDGTGRVEP